MYSAKDPKNSLRAFLAQVMHAGERKSVMLVDVRSAQEFEGQILAPPGSTEIPQLQESTPPIVPNTNPLSGEQSGIDKSNVWLANYSKTISPNLVFNAGLSAENKMQNYGGDNQKVNFAGVTGGNTMPIMTFNGQNAVTGWATSGGKPSIREPARNQK